MIVVISWQGEFPIRQDDWEPGHEGAKRGCGHLPSFDKPAKGLDFLVRQAALRVANVSIDRITFLSNLRCSSSRFRSLASIQIPFLTSASTTAQSGLAR